MSRQTEIRDVLLIGDSNVRRHLFRAGRHYAQSSDYLVARNTVELEEALKKIKPDQYRVVVFAMLTNLVVEAGSAGTDTDSRMVAISEYLGSLLQELK
jgi:hypothetical protein